LNDFDIVIYFIYTYYIYSGITQLTIHQQRDLKIKRWHIFIIKVFRNQRISYQRMNYRLH